MVRIDGILDQAWASARPAEGERAMLTLDRLLDEMPERGQGLHRYLMKCAVCAQACGLSPEEAIARIEPVAQMRCARFGEVAEAVAKAYGTVCPTVRTGARRSAPANRKQAPLCRDTIVRRFGELAPEFLMEQSPVPIPTDSREQTKAVLRALFQPEDILLLGNRYATKPLYARAWLKHLEEGHPLGPLIMPNPLSGQPGKTKEGKDSFRCDSAVKLPAPYLVVEFDDLPLKAQVAIINRLVDADLIDCVVYSGSKSIHCWVRVGAVSTEDWEGRVKELHGKLVNYGADPSTANLSRLSRLPGGIRTDNGNRVQTLLYLKGRQEEVAFTGTGGNEHDASK